MNTPTETRSASILPGLHGRLTVLQAGPHERVSVARHLGRLLEAGFDGPLNGTGPPARGAADFFDAAREAALRRIEEHERRRGELTSQLRRAREVQAAALARRDETAARVRRMSGHLDDCEALVEQAPELVSALAEARRNLEERRADVETAHGKLSLVEEQRAAAAQMIDDASHQLRYLEAAELDETSLRRELEKAGNELRAAEAAHAEATEALRSIEQSAAGRSATRDHVHYERNELIARLEAPQLDTRELQAALSAFDAETDPGEPDLVARELAREWVEVEEELDRIEAALPVPPSMEELEAAELRLQQADAVIAELEAAGQAAGMLLPEAREEIEAAHEAVLDAEERLDEPGAYDEAVAYLQQAREVEQAVLRRYGFETYLDVVLTGAPAAGEGQAELLDALRARRVAEETLAALSAAAEPPAIVTALQVRRDRILREAADLLCVDPGDSVAELLENHPAVPPGRVRELAGALADLGVMPVGESVRDAAVGVLNEQDDELAARDEYRREIERLERELEDLEREDARAAEHAQRVVEMADATNADLEMASQRVHLLESELVDRASQDERRLQRIAAAEQLRSQINAVTEALDRSNEEYHAALADAETAVSAAEGAVERTTAALNDAGRRLRRIVEALPPALRPRPADDPLAELPELREILSAEVERAEAALSEANEELDRADGEITQAQAELDHHVAVVPTEDIGDDDLVQAVSDLVGAGEDPVVLDDPFGEVPDRRDELLDQLVVSSEHRPVVLLTDDAETLGWAIGLPPEIGTVTRLPAPRETARAPAPVIAQPGPVG